MKQRLLWRIELWQHTNLNSLIHNEGFAVLEQLPRTSQIFITRRQKRQSNYTTTLLFGEPIEKKAKRKQILTGSS